MLFLAMVFIIALGTYDSVFIVSLRMLLAFRKWPWVLALVSIHLSVPYGDIYALYVPLTCSKQCIYGGFLFLKNSENPCALWKTASAS